MTPVEQRPLIVYARQSRSDEVSISLDRQVADCEQYAARNGIAVLDVVREESVSGRKSWRERELGTVVERCASGEAGGVLVAYRSRLTREDEVGTAEVRMALRPFRLVSADGTRDKKPGERTSLSDVIEDHQNGEAWEILAGHLREGKHESWVEGRWVGHDPSGYASPQGEWSKRRQRHLKAPLEIGPHMGAVREAFAMRKRGESWTSIAQMLTHAGVPTRGMYKAEREGREPTELERRWQTQSVSKMLASEIYVGRWKCTCGCGKVRTRRELRVVSLSTFNEVNAGRQSMGLEKGAAGRGGVRPGSGQRLVHSRHLLTGIVRCECCNHTLIYGRTASGEWNLQCRLSSCPARASVIAKYIEPEVERRVLEAVAQFDASQGERHDEAQQAELDAALEEAERAGRAQLEAAQVPAAMIPDLVAQLEPVVAARTAAEEYAAATLEWLDPEAVRARYEAGDVEERRAVLRKFLGSVTVRRRGKDPTVQLPDGRVMAVELPKRGSREDALMRIRIEMSDAVLAGFPAGLEPADLSKIKAVKLGEANAAE